MGVIGGLRVSNESYEDEGLNVCNCGLSVALRERFATDLTLLFIL